MITWKRRKKKNTRELYFFLLLWLSPSEKKQGRKKKTRQEKYSACLYLCKHNTVMGRWGAKFFNQLGTNKTHRRKQQKKNGIEFINDVAEKKKKKHIFVPRTSTFRYVTESHVFSRAQVCVLVFMCVLKARTLPRQASRTRHHKTQQHPFLY